MAPEGADALSGVDLQPHGPVGLSESTTSVGRGAGAVAAGGREVKVEIYNQRLQFGRTSGNFTDR